MRCIQCHVKHRSEAFCRNRKNLSAINYLRKKLHLRCLSEYVSVWIIFWSNVSCIQLEGIRIIWAEKTARKKSIRFKSLYRLFTTFQQKIINKNLHVINFMCAIFSAQTVPISLSCTLRKSKAKLFTVIFELHLMKSFYILFKLLKTWLTQFCAIISEIIFRRISFYYSHLPNFSVGFKI